MVFSICGGETQIERQAELGEHPHAANEVLPQAELQVRLVLDDPADALHQRVRGQRGHGRAPPPRPPQAAPGHDAGDPRLPPGQGRYPVGLLAVLREVALALHEDHLLDPDRPARPAKILGQMRPAQRREVVEPGVPQPRGIPKMHVGVDDGKIDHGDILLNLQRKVAMA